MRGFMSGQADWINEVAPGIFRIVVQLPIPEAGSSSFHANPPNWIQAGVETDKLLVLSMAENESIDKPHTVGLSPP